MLRFTLLALLLSGLLIACAGTPPSPVPPTQAAPAPSVAKNVTLRYFQLINPDLRDEPMEVALDQLRAQGYTVQESELDSSTLLADALARGDADVSLFNNQTAWAAAAKGGKIRTIAAPVASGAVVVANKSLTDCSQLDGKQMALPNSKGLNPTLLNQYLADNCKNAKPQIAVIPDINARFAALENNTVVASLMQQDDLLDLDKQSPGNFAIIASLRKAYPQLLVDGLHVNTNFAQKNPDLVRDLLRAIVLANRQAYDNTQVMMDDAAKRFKLDPGYVQKSFGQKVQDKLWDVNGGLTADNVKYTLDYLLKTKNLPDGVTADQVVDLSYLNAVLDEVGRK
jgi:ABC-type nitrate/sulfonate/bicarbonate transport system substrate-binding protein